MTEAQALANAFAPLTAAETAAAVNDNPSEVIVSPIPMDAPPRRFDMTGWRIAQTDDYVDADGRTLFIVVRYEKSDSTGQIEKTIRPWLVVRRPDGTLRWTSKSLPAPRPVLGLPAVLAAERVLVVEGEKTARAAAALFPDWTVTTASSGAKAAKKTDWSWAAGKTILIAPDLDEAGEVYARVVADLCRAAEAAQVLRLDVGRLAASVVEGGAAVERGGAPKDGYDLADSVRDGWTADLVAECFGADGLFAPLVADAANDNAEDAKTARTGPLQHPFRLKDHGVERMLTDKEGNVSWKWICSPIEVLGLARDTEGHDWSLVVRVQDPDGRYHEVLLPHSMFAGEGAAIHELLFSRGLRCLPDRGTKKEVLEYLATAPTDTRVRLVDRIGVHGDAYVLPNATYGDAAGERTVLRTDSDALRAFRCSGTLDEWKRLAALAVGNSRLLLALSAAFLGPLLSLVGSGGVGIHIRGGCSTGKTTTLYLAGSVWGGGGAKGMLFQWRTTDNAAESIALARNDNVLLMDEIGEATAQVVFALAYMLLNGAGKGRATRTGDGRPVKTWRLVLLSTGEISLADKFAEQGKKAMAGQEVRLVDVAADAGVGLGLFENLHGFAGGGALADHIVAESKRVHGVAGRAFLEALFTSPERTGEAAKCVMDFRNDFVAEHCPVGADRQVERVAKHFGLIAAAGELAVAMGVLPWPEGEATRGVASCFDAWLANRGGLDSHEEQAAVAHILGFLQLHGASRFDEWRNESGGGPAIIDHARDRIGWRWLKNGRWEYLATVAGFAEMCRGFDKSLVTAALIEKKILSPDGKGKSSHSIPVPGHGRQRLYVLRPPEDSVGG